MSTPEIKDIIDEKTRLEKRVYELEKLLIEREEEHFDVINKLNNSIRDTQKIREELFELFPEVIYEINTSGYITFASKKAFETFGYSENDLKNGLHITDLVIPAETVKISDRFYQLIEKKIESRGAEYTAVTKSGRKVPVLLYNQLIIKQNKVTGIRGLMVNISDRKHIENELRHHQEISDQIYNITPSGIFTVNNKRIITSWNKRAEEITGYKASEVIGKECFIFSTKGCKGRCGVGKDCFQESNPKNRECHITTKHGKKRIVNKVTGYIRNKTGKIIGGIECFDDVTLQKAQINDLVKAREKAVESDYLKSAFLANMSHEIRTPINGILGFVELIKNGHIPEEEQSQYLEIIKKSGNQLLTLVSDIIDISKIEANELSINCHHFSLNSMMDELDMLFKQEIKNRGKNIELSAIKDIINEVSYINSDQVRLKQVLSNLLINAIKFTESGSIVFGYTVKGQDLEFYVKDTGKGIPQHKLEVIFDRFTQGEENCNTTSGTGLGLAISKGIVNLMGGKIFVQSKEMEGSEFYFTIPYTPVLEKNKVRKQGKNNNMNYNWKGRKLLLVEDDDVNFKFLELMLKRTHIEVLRACDGQMAIDLCKQHEDIDLVLMDIQLPKIDGYEATRTIKKFKPNLPIIAQTANAMSDDEQKCHEAGCSSYITKPINSRILFETIDGELKGITV